MPAIGDQQLALAEDYAQALDGLADRASANTTAAFSRSLRITLANLRRFYQGFNDRRIPDETNYKGEPRRPYEYSIREAAARFNEIARLARDFMPPDELNALEKQYRIDLSEAMAMGEELAATLHRLTEDDPSASVGPAMATREALRSSVERTSAYIRGELSQFRDGLTQLVTDALARGKGFRGVERDVRRLLEGARDPDGLTQRMGLNQRAELIARSEIANAYVEGQRRRAMAMGYSYVRWVATPDERTCPTCGSRHGLIYPVGEVVAPAHPRCRCGLQIVPNEAVEEQDEQRRQELLDQDFWDASREDMYKEFAEGKGGDAKGWTADRAKSYLNDRLIVPSPSERRLYPSIKESLRPMVMPRDGWIGGTGKPE